MKLTGPLAAVALAIAAPALGQAGAPAPAAPEPVTVIHAGTLLATPGHPARREASVVVRGRRITEIRDGYAQVPGARVVDLRDSTVMPGFIDMHVHLGGLDDRSNRDWRRRSAIMRTKRSPRFSTPGRRCWPASPPFGTSAAVPATSRRFAT